MPNLLEPPWNTLVPLIPVADHCVSVEAGLWQPRFQAAGRAQLHKQILADRSYVRLTRSKVLNFAYPSVQQKCLEILLWGYPTGMQGRQHLAFLQNLDSIATAAARHAPWPEYYGQLKALGHLGISTISKLAYFHQLTFEGCRALILDQKIIAVMAGGNWQPLGIVGMDYDHAHARYLEYLRQVHGVAETLRAAPDQLELFLFCWGKAF